MHNIHYLPDIILLLSAAVFVVAIFKHLKLSPVLGYLVAGAAIGEYGFNVVNSKDLTLFAEFGVVFLLFAIGLELTIERLMAMRWHVFGFGTAQLLITAAALGAISHYGFGLSIEISVIIGGALALSSTAIVLRVIADRGEQVTQVGRLALANLILQDFAVVPLLVLIPLLVGGPDQTNIAITLSKVFVEALLYMALIFILGRMILRPIFSQIANVKSNELFIAATLLVVLGLSFITESRGLSLALGAFIAGLLLAETEYKHQVEDAIIPFKGLFMGLFFMTVGMTIDIISIYNNLTLILLLSLLLLSVKALIITILCKVFRFPFGSSIQAGLLLSQGGEFAFILFGLASKDSIGLIDHKLAEILLTVVTVTMAITPLLAILGGWIARKLDMLRENVDVCDEVNDLTKHAVVIGYGEIGRMLCKIFTSEKINFLAVDIDITRVKAGKRLGHPVLLGDAGKGEILNNIGIERARVVVITVPQSLAAKKIIKAIRKVNSEIMIIVKTVDMKNSKSLERVGANEIIPEKYEGGLHLTEKLLTALGTSDPEIERIKGIFRSDKYEKVATASS